MRGSRRVITFCLLTVVLPTTLIVVPIYLRHVNYANVMYKISESDIIQIHKGQSSIFCNKHSLLMNTTFNAFQMKGKPELSNKRKHLKLKKCMTLPDETLEYWGFYLFKGATVELKACSRYKGSKILVVKGDKILNTCGILENKFKKNQQLLHDIPQVKIILEKHENNTNILTSEDSQYDVSYKQKKYPDDISRLKIDTNEISEEVKKLSKRDTKNIPPLHDPNTILDTGVNHGGNALMDTQKDVLVSSFENNLRQCFHNNILINKEFPFSNQCNSKNYIEETTVLKVIHEVVSDGYYYYIFFSDHDQKNDLYAIFDIHKPTFQYANMSDSKQCLNKTNCDFDVSFFSDELVIVEVPTKDGLNNEENDSSVLTSICHPRMSIYIFFPITVLILVLLFAFL